MDMRKKWKAMAAVCMSCGLLAAQITGCGQKKEGTVTVSSAETDTVPSTEVQTSRSEKQKSITYDEEDLDVSWDENSATGIVMDESGITVVGKGARADGNTVVIEKAGTYVLSGVLSDGQICMEAEEGETVHLVLNGAEISCQTSSPIYSSGKCKVVLTLEAETKNRVSDGAEYQFAEGADEPDAAIFTKGDLTVNGTGELDVTGNYACGIRSKDDLKVVSGVIRVNAKEDGLKGRDSVVIRDGQIDLVTGKDGIKSNNDEEEDKGYIRIDGGVISITAEDDGIQAETALVVNDGEIEIRECQEGLAGKTVDILGGVIAVNAQDDGINSAGPAETEQEKMQNQKDVYLRIAGGEVRVNAQADGIDSNGDFYMEGGVLYLSGPTGGGNGILDYNGKAVLTGGTMIAAGNAGMMQTFGADSVQNYLVVYYDERQEAGTAVQLTDAAGEELAEYAPEKEFSVVILTAPGLEKGKTYRVVTGENIVELTVSGLETSQGTPLEGGRGMRGQGGRGSEGMKPPEEGGGKKERAGNPDNPDRPARGMKQETEDSAE